MTAWSRERPTKAGWYWYRSTDQDGSVATKAVEIIDSPHGLQVMYGDDGMKLDRIRKDSEWQGPITPEP